jgi:antitoxin PrlF
MSAPLIKEIATVTAKGQTTLPKAVRQALSVGPGDKIAYEIDPAGHVVVSRADSEVDDPVLTAFLGFIAQDMAANPQNLALLPADLLERIDALVGQTDIDLNDAIEGDIAL